MYGNITCYPHIICWVVSTSWLLKNNVAMNNHVQVFVWTYVFIFIRYVSRKGTAGSHNFIFNFLMSCLTFSRVAAPLYFPLHKCEYDFSHLLANLFFWLQPSKFMSSGGSSEFWFAFYSWLVISIFSYS